MKVAMLGVAWAILSAALPSNASTVKGIVIDHLGATQPAAQVELRDGHNHIVKKFKTAEDGRFEFTGVQAGHYSIYVTARCFKLVKKSVQVGAAPVSEVNVELGSQQRQCNGID